MRKLVRRAYPDCGSTFQEDFAIEQFKNALDDYELKRALFQGKPTSLDEAVEIVAEAEAWYKTEKAGQSRVLIPEATKKASGCPTTNSDLVEMLYELMDAQKRQLRSEKKPKDWKPGYWNCGSLQHFRAECPAPAVKPTALNKEQLGL